LTQYQHSAPAIPQHDIRVAIWFRRDHHKLTTGQLFEITQVRACSGGEFVPLVLTFQLDLTAYPHCGAILLDGRMRMNRVRVHHLLQSKTTVVDDVRHRLSAVDMRSQVRGIIDPSLDGEHIDAIRAEHDMVDFLQAANVSGNGQRDREIALLVLAFECAMRQLLNSL
jgi:hypothetical protein